MLEINFTCVIFVFSFLAFISLLDLTLWKPVRKIKEERATDLVSEKDKAAEAEVKTKSIIDKVNSEIESMKKAESELIDGLFKDFNKQKEQEENKIKQELEVHKQKAYAEIAEEQKSLLSFADQESSKLAQNIVSKLTPELNLSKEVGAK